MYNNQVSGYVNESISGWLELLETLYQFAQIELVMLHSNIWKYLTECK